MRVLYLIACGAGPAPDVGRLVEQAQQRQWDVHVIATPAAVGFLDIGSLEAQTGHAVRSEHRRAGAGSARSLPQADAIIVAPATYNTINKWAMGVSDNYALGILAESVGLRIPTVVLPFVNAALAAHPAFQHSVAVLRDARVGVVLGPGEFEPHPPGTGADRLDSFPWHRALDRAEHSRQSRRVLPVRPPPDLDRLLSEAGRGCPVQPEWAERMRAAKRGT